MDFLSISEYCVAKAHGRKIHFLKVCGVGQLGCGVAQLVVRQLAVLQAPEFDSGSAPQGGPLLNGEQ